jgi:succinyl-diaminopimelate desuccinylase
MTDALISAKQHAIELIKCPSVTPLEGGALDYLQARLSTLGFTCHRLLFKEQGTPDVDNLYARIGTGAPHLCYAGHTDVVPAGDASDWTHPPFDGTVDEGVLYGRGAADMKGGIACFLAAVEEALLAGGLPDGSLSFLITGDEEGPAINGTVKMLDWLEEQGEQIDHCVVGEPTNPSEIGEMIKIGRRGSINGEITVIGQQGHVAYQHLALNPIDALARVITEIASAPLDAGTEAFMPSNLEFTNLEVDNDAVNIIPARARARFNIRFNNAQTPEGLKALIKERTQKALAGSDYDAEFSFRLSGESFLTPPGLLSDTLSAAIEAVTGRVPELSTSGGTSDARFIKNHCPVVEFGLVNATIHQVNEQVPVAHLEELTKIYVAFIKSYFSTASS